MSGSITFDGQPIPKGTVLFQPDESKGCTGSAGIALIRDGKYDTAAEGGTGVVGGPHLVRIVGLDGKPIDSMSPDGIPLFPDYTTTVELPKANSTQDFAVPKDSKRSMKPKVWFLLAGETKAGTAIADCCENPALEAGRFRVVLPGAVAFAAVGDDSASERPEIFPAVFLRRR